MLGEPFLDGTNSMLSNSKVEKKGSTEEKYQYGILCPTLPSPLQPPCRNHVPLDGHLDNKVKAFVKYARNSTPKLLLEDYLKNINRDSIFLGDKNESLLLSKHDKERHGGCDYQAPKMQEDVIQIPRKRVDTSQNCSSICANKHSSFTCTERGNDIFRAGEVQSEQQHVSMPPSKKRKYQRRNSKVAHMFSMP